MFKKKTIFISYRRSDSASEAGRIYDHLVQKFGRKRVFKDVDSIPYGVTFRDYLQTALSKCDIAVILIGPDWLNTQDENGNRRLDNPNDLVRIEIELALKRQLAVIPVLVKGARLPNQSKLPTSIQDIMTFNGATVRPDPDFRRDIQRLITSIEALSRPETSSKGTPITRVLIYISAALISLLTIGAVGVRTIVWVANQPIPTRNFGEESIPTSAPPTAEETVDSDSSSRTITITSDTLFKKRLVLSSQLSDNEKIFVKRDSEFEIDSISQAEANHFKVVFTDSETNGDLAGSVWYIYAPDTDISALAPLPIAIAQELNN